MTKTKTTTIFNIIGQGIKLYIQNIVTLSNPVVAPVLGMLAGIILAILPVYFIPNLYANWANHIPLFKELYMSIITIIVTMLPGLILLKISFWNYMLKFVSLNNIVGDILKKKVLKAHQHYTQVVALRTKDYLLMLGIWCSIILMGIILPIVVFLLNIEPLFMPYLFIGFEFLAIFLLTILSIYLSLSFQVFAFETAYGPMQTLEESFRLVLNNFWRMFTLLLMLTIITGIIVPQLFVFLADILMLKTTLSVPFQVFLENLFETYDYMYEYMQSFPVFEYDSQEKLIFEASKHFTFGLISSLISLLMMPLGSCFYTLFYLDAKKRHAPKIEEAPSEPKSKGKSKKSAKAK